MTTERTRTCWALLFRSDNLLDGYMECLGETVLFDTREQARRYLDTKYDYLRNRPDLRAEPHGWKMPQVVKVEVIVRMVDTGK